MHTFYSFFVYYPIYTDEVWPYGSKVKKHGVSIQLTEVFLSLLQSLEKQHENVMFEKDELQEELAEMAQLKDVCVLNFGSNCSGNCMCYSEQCRV